MVRKKQHLNRIISIIGVSIFLNFIPVSFYSSLKAEKSETVEEKDAESENYLPTYRRDAGTRGNCFRDRTNFFPLVGKDIPNSITKNNPNLFFHLPETKEDKTIELILRNKEDKLLYSTLLKTSKDSGIVNIKIPQYIVLSQLQKDRDYHWYLSIICDTNQRSKDLVLDGWVKYLIPQETISEKINTLNPRQKAEIYLQQGLWSNYLSLAISEKEKNTQLHIKQTLWSEIMDSIGLLNLAEKPLLKIKSPNLLQFNSKDLY